jgi:hypothetical protein
MSKEGRCRHYQPVGHHKECALGIPYSSFADSALRWPCLNPDYAHLCEHWEAFTPEEIAEHERRVQDSVMAFVRLVARETSVCPHCGQRITSMHQVGRCVYGSCGCRLFQGAVPDAWRDEQ